MSSELTALLSTAITVCVGGLVRIQVKKLERKNSEQHDTGRKERETMEERIREALERSAAEKTAKLAEFNSTLIDKLDRQDVVRGIQVEGLHGHVGSVEQKLDAHIKDRSAHN